MSDEKLTRVVSGNPEEVAAEWERQAREQRPSLAVCRAMARFWSRMAEQAEAAAGSGQPPMPGDQARCAESEFEV